MNSAFTFAGALLVLLLGALAPGFASFRFFRFPAGSRIESAIAIPVVGLTLSGSSVLLLLSCGLYTPLTGVFVLVTPVVYLALAERMQMNAPEPIRPARDLWMRLTLADKVALVAAGALISSAFLDASTSPATWWDGYITWDKWAMDWARRSNLYGYLQVYPQLFPMFSSLVYKLTFSSGTVLPASSFALHAIHPVLGAISVLAICQLAGVLRVPVWPLVLALLAMRTFREQLTSGAADMMVTTFVLVATAVGLRLIEEGRIAGQGARAILTILLFGAAAVKTTGFLAVAVVAGFLLISLPFRSWSEAARLHLKGAAWLVLLPLLLNVPFYAVEIATERQLSIEQQDPRELNFSFAHVSWAWSKGRNAKHGADLTPREAITEFLDDFAVPARYRSTVVVLGVLFLFAGLFELRTWAIAVPVLLYVLVWARLFSYDLRNLLPVVPFAGLWLSLGGVVLWRAAAASGGRSVRVVGASISASLVVGALWYGCLPFLASRWHQLVGDRALLVRLQSLRGTPVDRIRTFFPDQYPYYLLLQESGLAASARQVVAGAHLYRWFTNGRYPWARFSWGELRRGDVFVGVPNTAPLQAARWVPIREDALRVQVFDPDVQPVNPTSLNLLGDHPPLVSGGPSLPISVTFTGAGSALGFDVPPDQAGAGERVIWDATCLTGEGGGQISAFYASTDPLLINDAASTTAVGTSEKGLSRLSGMVTVVSGRHPTRDRGQLTIGLRSDVAGTRCELTRFVFGSAAR